MPRESWSDILVYYLNYVENMQPILEQVKRFVINIEPDLLLNKEVLDEEIRKEEKRSSKKVKSISEFTAMLRREIFRLIWNFVNVSRLDTDTIDIKDKIIDFLDESLIALKIMNNLTNPDQSNVEDTLLYKLTSFISEFIFPSRSSKNEIFDALVESSVDCYDMQRHILSPATYYRESLDLNEIPGFSPTVYRILMEITSLFNLNPNYLDSPENDAIDIPVIMKSDVFDPFIDSIASKEENAINKILNRIELRIIDGIFIGPTSNFISLTEKHNYINRNELSNGKIRIIPQFSNETLPLLNLANIAYRRGFLSKELINWISSNFAFLIYTSIIKSSTSEDNVFLRLFYDLKTEEKILPFLMKLLCFENYLRMDRTKIRDSIQYRKEIFNTLGSSNYDSEFLGEIIDYLSKEIEENFVHK